MYKYYIPLLFLPFLSCTSDDPITDMKPQEPNLRVKTITIISDDDWLDYHHYEFFYDQNDQLDSVVHLMAQDTVSYRYEYTSKRVLFITIHSIIGVEWRKITFDGEGMIIEKDNSWMDPISIVYRRSGDTIYYDSDFGNTWWTIDEFGNKRKDAAWEIDYDDRKSILSGTGLSFYIDSRVDLDFLGYSPFTKNNPTRIYMANLGDLRTYTYVYNEWGYPVSAQVRREGQSFFSQGEFYHISDFRMDITYY